MKSKHLCSFGLILGVATLVLSGQTSLSDGCLGSPCFGPLYTTNGVDGVLTCMMSQSNEVKVNLRLRMSECYIFHGCFESCFQNSDIVQWLWDIDTFSVLPSRYSPVNVSDYGDIILANSVSPTQDDLQVMLGTCIYPPCSLD